MRVSVRSQVSRFHTSFSVRGRFDPRVINGFNHEKKIPVGEKDIGKKALNSQSSAHVEESTIQNVASLVKAMITKQRFSSYSHNPVHF